MRYEDVVKKAQETLKNRKEYGNDSVELYACPIWLAGNQINLWSYWQGYQIKDIDEGIDILLVGQDWGTPDNNVETIRRIERLQENKTDTFYNDYGSLTDRNLKDLFQCLGCDIGKKDPGKRILFTNYCLGYRKGSETGGMTKQLLDMDSELFDDLVNAAKPRIIICLGKLTYEAVIGRTVQGFTDYLKSGKPFKYFYHDTDIVVYGVAHCGARGTNNVGGMEIMRKAWEVIAKEFNGASADTHSDAVVPGYTDRNINKMLSIYKNMVSEVDELERMFPGRYFTLDGHMIGSIGEAAAAYYYGIELSKTSQKAVDGVINDKYVQIKVVQQDNVMLSYDGNGEEPYYLLVLYLNKSGTFYEVYNGLWKCVFDAIDKYDSHGYKHVSINKLMEIDTTGSERIEQKKHVEKMRKEFKNIR